THPLYPIPSPHHSSSLHLPPSYSPLTSTPSLSYFFFFNDTAPPEIYTLSLHDALPISVSTAASLEFGFSQPSYIICETVTDDVRSEEHTSELQSLTNLVCRLLLEKKKKKENKDTCNNKTYSTKTRE